MSNTPLGILQKTIRNFEQTTLFSNDENYIEEACVNYLKSKGYRVITPKVFTVEIKKLDDLISYFYTLLNNRSKGYASSYNINKDRAIAKRFVEGRMEAGGLDKKYALNECGEIIKTIFDHIDKFKFKYEINFAIFGQGNLKWVTDKALQIMNKTFEVKEEQDAENLRQSAINLYAEEDLGFNDLDELLKNLEQEDV